MNPPIMVTIALSYETIRDGKWVEGATGGRTFDASTFRTVMDWRRSYMERVDFRNVRLRVIFTVSTDLEYDLDSTLVLDQDLCHAVDEKVALATKLLAVLQS